MPSWATGEKQAGDSDHLGDDSAQATRGAGSDDVKSEEAFPGDGGAEDGRSATTSAAGSLAHELRQRVFELEAQVSELQGNLSDAREMMRGVGGGVADGDGEILYCTFCVDLPPM